MTDRKPALEVWEYEDGQTLRHVARASYKRLLHGETRVILASDIPPAILALTAPELRALAVFAEAMPEMIGKRGISIRFIFDLRDKAYDAALAAAKETK